MGTKIEKDGIVLPELSYQIIGACYDACNQMGVASKEKYFQKAVSLALTKRGIAFSEQVYCPLFFDGQVIGKYYFDFLIEEKIVLELKVSSRFKQADYAQLKEYLRTRCIPLGILARFDRGSVVFNRVLPPLKNT